MLKKLKKIARFARLALNEKVTARTY